MILLMVAAIGAVLYFTKPWGKISLLPKEPKLDVSKSYSDALNPLKATTLYVLDKQKVLTTVEIAKGSVFRITPVQVTPFDGQVGIEIKTKDEIAFFTPATLTFDLSKSSIKNKKVGKVHVYNLSGDKKIPVLVSRQLQNESLITARIISSGTYILDLTGSQENQFARNALSDVGVNSLTIIEAATTLINNNQKLNEKEKKKVADVAEKIINQKSPPMIELVSAIILTEKLKKLNAAIVKPALAQGDSLSKIRELCNNKTSAKFEDYIGGADVAAFFGDGALSATCERAAKEVATNQAETLIADPNAAFENVLTLLNKIKVFLPDERNLIEKLEKKLKEIAKRDLEKVLNDANATAEERDKALKNAEIADHPEKSLEEKVAQKTLVIIKTSEDINNEPLPTPMKVPDGCPVGPEPKGLPFSYQFRYEGTDYGVREYAKICYHTYTGYATSRYISIGFESGNSYECREFNSTADADVFWDTISDNWDRWADQADKCLGINAEEFLRDYYPDYSEFYDDIIEIEPVVPEPSLEPIVSEPPEPSLAPIINETLPPEPYYPPPEEEAE